ncbi:MAG: 2OG-Fe(II) oxygenase [Pseudomonadota bacterium]
MLSVAATSTSIGADGAALLRLQLAFQHSDAMVLPHFVEKKLLQQLQGMLESAEFAPRNLEILGGQDLAQHDRAGRALNLVLARPELFRWLERVTACGPIGEHQGSVMQLHGGQYLDWHDDMNDKRRALAITICLSDVAYQGGQFQLRRKLEPQRVFSHVHADAGTALVFATGPTLEHRVTPVVASAPRIVYAGWFLKAAAR